MNTPQAPQEEEPSPGTSSPHVLFGTRRIGRRTAGLVFALLAVMVLAMTVAVHHISIDLEAMRMSERASEHTPPEYETVSARIKELKRLNLWQISPEIPVPLVEFKKYPDDFEKLRDVRVRKKVFLHSLLPVAMIALDEIREERFRLLQIIEKTGYPEEDLVFSDEDDELRERSWKYFISAEDQKFIRTLSRKYRTSRADLLVSRVDVLPVSLILAQGAMESSWGRSRFAREGNNLFGIWTWNDNGIIPANRDAGKNHMVRSYDSILDSVRSYMLTLNRVKAYEPLRRIRLETKDSQALTQGLMNYSEKKDRYIASLQEVIKHNRLQDYDQLSRQFENQEQRRALLHEKGQKRTSILTALNDIF